MPVEQTYQVVFSDNQISSVTPVKKPKVSFSGKAYISSTRFQLIFAYIKAVSLSKAMKEAERIIEKYLQ